MAARSNRFFDDEADRELRRMRLEKNLDKPLDRNTPEAKHDDGKQALEQASFLLMVIALAVFVAVGVYFLAS